MNPRYNCIVPQCEVSADPTIPKFPFPYDIVVGEKWLNLVCSPILRNIPYQEIRVRRFKVCAEHFAENTSYPTTISRSLISGTLPTLKLPDSRDWQPIYIHDKEIDLKKLEEDTTLDNAFAEEFSSSFTYSDSSSIPNIKDSQLPIRGKTKKEWGFKDKNNRRKYKKKRLMGKASLENNSGSDWEMEIVEGVAKRRKKARLELSDDDFESVEETTDLKIERIPCNSDDSEKETDYEGFEEVSSDEAAIETRSIVRNVYPGKGSNNEKIREYSFVEVNRNSPIENTSRNETNKEIIRHTFAESKKDFIFKKTSIQEANNENLINYTFGEVKPGSKPSLLSKETTSILRNLSPKKEANEEKLIVYTFGEAKKDSSKETAPKKETGKVEIIENAFGEAKKDSSIETTSNLRKSSRQEEKKLRLVKYVFGDAEYDYSVPEPTPIIRKSSIQKANKATKKKENKEMRKKQNEEKRKKESEEMRKKESEEMRKKESEEMRKKENEEMRKKESEEMRKKENEEMRKKENEENIKEKNAETIKEEKLETKKKENRETRKKGNKGTKKKEIQEKISEYVLGETERAELINVDGKLYDTDNNKMKRQVYKTTLKFKRNNVETGKIVEDVFIIEHTFKSTCRKCPNHQNDTVSCTMKKIK